MTADFFQTGPRLENTFQSDPLLKKWMTKKLTRPHQEEALLQLDRCGAKAILQWSEFSKDAQKNIPRHVPFDAWGRRIDHIEMSNGWRELEKEAAREGIVATAYDRKWRAQSRIHQMALLYLFHPSSAFVSCPLAMTDGAARCLETLGATLEQKKAFQNLISKNPEQFWTSGQWMTEKTGGSDVGGTSTQALASGQEFKLFGTKWFTSATTAQMSLALAKLPGSETLSLFFVELRDSQGKLKNIEILRLKDKLGTQAMPTAELQLKGTPAQLVGEAGHGVKSIATMLNITRTYNAICSVAHMRRGLDLLQSYSRERRAFGHYLKDLPLHKSWLQELEYRWRRCFAFAFTVAELLGLDECGEITQQQKLELRLMTPLLKLYTARECMSVTSQVCEGFGGTGYIEDSGIPVLLRDAQVFSIWEGTTHVLVLDFLRAIKKEPGSRDWLQEQLNAIQKNLLHLSRESQQLFGDLQEQYVSSVSNWEDQASPWALGFARLYAENKLLIETGMES